MPPADPSLLAVVLLTVMEAAMRKGLWRGKVTLVELSTMGTGEILAFLRLEPQ